MLAELQALGDATAAELAVATRIPPDRITEMCRRLVDAGWVRVTDSSGPLPLVGMTHDGLRTTSLVHRDAVGMTRAATHVGVVRPAGEMNDNAYLTEVEALTRRIDSAVERLKS